MSKEAPVGFSSIRLEFELDTDVGSAELDKLMTLTERYCVVYQTLVGRPKLSVSRRTS